MPSQEMLFILVAEFVALLIIVCALLIFQNRSLRGLVKKLKARMEDLVTDLRKRRDKSETPTAFSGKDYLKWIEEQLQSTRKHHQSLGPNQDIVLDIALDVPLPLRTAALRNAVLLAEKEALNHSASGEADWRALRDRYEKIFSFFEDFKDDGVSEQAEIDRLSAELANAKQRVNNLEKFKSLYFDLEEKWDSVKDEAQGHYQNLSEMASQMPEPEAFTQALDDYHATYHQISPLIDGGVENIMQMMAAAKENAKESDNAGEIRHLRQVASEQHKVIGQLQKRLRESSSSDEIEHIVGTLEGELQKQMRFVKESETCIQLMEDELNNANREIEQLTSRLGALPEIKASIIAMRADRDDLEIKVHRLAQENRKLRKHAQSSTSSSGENTADGARLRNELTTMEAKYNELEERYLDLKMQNN